MTRYLQFWLDVEGEREYVRHVELSDPNIIFGREGEMTDPGNGRFVDLSDAPNLTRISRRHFTIMNNGGNLFIKDHSGNGTFVNGYMLAPKHFKLLKIGDEITVADKDTSFVMVFSDLDGPDSLARKTPPPIQATP